MSFRLKTQIQRGNRDYGERLKRYFEPMSFEIIAASRNRDCNLKSTSWITVFETIQTKFVIGQSKEHVPPIYLKIKSFCYDILTSLVIRDISHQDIHSASLTFRSEHLLIFPWSAQLVVHRSPSRLECRTTTIPKSADSQHQLRFQVSSFPSGV